MLLTPSFSPEGSNRKKFETEVYSLFVKYLREAASKFHNNIYTCITGAITLDLHLLATYTANITKNDLSTMAVSNRLLSSIMLL